MHKHARIVHINAWESRARRQLREAQGMQRGQAADHLQCLSRSGRQHRFAERARRSPFWGAPRDSIMNAGGRRTGSAWVGHGRDACSTAGGWWRRRSPSPSWASAAPTPSAPSSRPCRRSSAPRAARSRSCSRSQDSCTSRSVQSADRWRTGSVRAHSRWPACCCSGSGWRSPPAPARSPGCTPPTPSASASGWAAPTCRRSVRCSAGSCAAAATPRASP